MFRNNINEVSNKKNRENNEFKSTPIKNFLELFLAWEGKEAKNIRLRRKVKELILLRCVWGLGVGGWQAFNAPSPTDTGLKGLFSETQTTSKIYFQRNQIFICHI